LKQQNADLSILVAWAEELVESTNNKCENCSYDSYDRLVHLCGYCEEEAIKERIKWWQDGKRKLNERE